MGRCSNVGEGGAGKGFHERGTAAKILKSLERKNATEIIYIFRDARDREIKRITYKTRPAE